MRCPEHICKGTLFKGRLEDNSQQAEGCWTCNTCMQTWFINKLPRAKIKITKEDILKQLKNKYKDSTKESLNEFYKNPSFGQAGIYHTIVEIISSKGCSSIQAEEIAKEIFSGPARHRKAPFSNRP